MSRGRKPLPEGLKKIRGTSQPCRQVPVVVGYSKVILQPKTKLQPSAKKIFKDIARELIACGVLDVVSIPLLTAYAQEIAVYYDLMTEIDGTPETTAEGYIVKEQTKYGVKIKINPKRIAALQALQAAKTIASDFGFTPATKARISAILNQAPKNDNDEFAEFEQL